MHLHTVWRCHARRCLCSSLKSEIQSIPGKLDLVRHTTNANHCTQMATHIDRESSPPDQHNNNNENNKKMLTTHYHSDQLLIANFGAKKTERWSDWGSNTRLNISVSEYFSDMLISIVVLSHTSVCKRVKLIHNTSLPPGERACISLLADRGGTVTGLDGMSLGTGDHEDRFSPTHNSYL